MESCTRILQGKEEAEIDSIRMIAITPAPKRNRRLLTARTLALVLALSAGPAWTEVLQLWDFSTGSRGWTPNGNLVSFEFTEVGWVLDSIAEDPFLVGPPTDYPFTPLARVTVRVRSNADSQGKVFWGETFAEERSREFTVIPDGEWHEYEVYIPTLGLRSRLRIDPSHLTGRIELAWIRVESVPDPTLDNGTLEIRLDLQAGGAIAYLGPSGSGRNLINLHDRGRYIQQSYYAGQRLDRRDEGQSSTWSPWPWNPIQVGDAFGNASVILAAWVRDGTAYTKCQPLLWDMRNEKAECHMEMWVTLEGRTVHVENRLTCFRTDNRWNLTQNHQELPAVYSIGNLYRLFTYLGNDPWSSESPNQIQNSGPPWEYWDCLEKWAALLDSNGFGIGIYNSSTTSYVGGFHDSPGGGPYDNSTGYFSPLRTESLGKNTVLSYEYDLIVGSIHDIRESVYRKERRIYVGGPTSTPTFTPSNSPTPSPTRTATNSPSPTPSQTSTETFSLTPTSTPLSPNFIVDMTLDPLDLLEFLRRWRDDRTISSVDLDGNDIVDGRDPMVFGVHWKETTAPSGG